VSPSGNTYDPSPEVLRALAKTFAGPVSSLKTPAWPEPEVMDRAVAAGVMFREPRTLDHDGWVGTAHEVVRQVSAEEVAEAFLASLTSHRLDLRSALGSWAVARFLPEHPLDLWHQHNSCRVCGFSQRADRPRDLNWLNWARFFGGGVNPTFIAYLAFDLEQFAYAPRLRPTAADLDLARRVLDYLRGLPPQTTAAKALSGLTMVKGNSGEREGLLTILGACGILATADHPGFTDRFIPYSEQELPSQRFVFGVYPVCWWRASDGVNDDALLQFLPQLA
jgi:hypothetical protein